MEDESVGLTNQMAFGDIALELLTLKVCRYNIYVCSLDVVLTVVCCLNISMPEALFTLV